MVQNPPLLAIACILLMASTAMLGLIIMKAAAGLATMLINIYTTRDGDWSIMVLITTIITGVTLVAACLLTMVFKFIKLKEAEEAH
ncbi:hypothetical protein BJY01DRAFT_239192 [Aspergillus pseudoustus]|uniref:Uncharacterized protein n=1 Tax=Aspergillus pseudoustus TaxID=1810923 RepID=A0ABR4J2F1_9EURO